jgi:hypothetical protein
MTQTATLVVIPEGNLRLAPATNQGAPYLAFEMWASTNARMPRCCRR